MPSQNAQTNGSIYQWVSVRAEPAGQFTAQAIGLPDVHATAATSAEAIARVQTMVNTLIAAGQLVPIQLPIGTQQRSPKTWDPNDPELKEFIEILEEHAREDLEQTLRELDQECSNSPSTPTT
jgi:hypothetical protein